MSVRFSFDRRAIVVVQSCAGNLQLPPTHLGALIARMDSDGSGEIDAAEFSKVWHLTDALTGWQIDETQRAAADQVAELFTHHDEDGSGSISRDEFASLFDQLKVRTPTRRAFRICRAFRA